MQNRSGATKLVNGFLWPAYDEACAAVVFASTPDLDRAIRQCQGKRLAIQAGGNCGVWAKHLGGIFDKVWTWEPDPINFQCLAHNTGKQQNVFCIQAALGEHSGLVEMDAPEPNNCGALQIAAFVDGSEPAYSIPVVRIDDYLIEEVDLIYLDLEGFELPAIRGAAETVRRCQPIIAVEDKGLSERYGIDRGDVLRFIESEFGYEICDRYARDFVLRPKARR